VFNGLIFNCKRNALILRALNLLNLHAQFLLTIHIMIYKNNRLCAKLKQIEYLFT